METAIKISNLSKQYRLGEVGTGSLSDDLKRFWYKVRGKEDPFTKVSVVNDRTKVSESDYVWSLKDINVEVKKGEVLGVIGRNGAGKSTLLKILSRVTGPTTGSVSMKGRIASLLEVGTGFHPDLTGRENIYLNGAILGMTKKEVSRKLDDIVQFAGVANYLDTPVKRYSSGMKVRLGFAVAAHLEPEILIVDEVLAVGDAEFQRRAVGKMQEVSSGSGRTVLFVSHNMNSISHLCDRALVLDQGRVHFIGNTEEAIQEYGKLQTNEEFRLSNEFEKGNGIIWFDRVSLVVNDDPKKQQVRTGDKITLTIDYSLGGEELSNGDISVAFYDVYDVPITALNMQMVNGGLWNTDKKQGTITCDINKLNLMPGVYRVAILCTVNGEQAHLEMGALLIEVVEGDYFDSGRIYPNAKVKTLVEHSWRIG